LFSVFSGAAHKGQLLMFLEEMALIFSVLRQNDFVLWKIMTLWLICLFGTVFMQV
jgi:hypothetical protein